MNRRCRWSTPIRVIPAALGVVVTLGLATTFGAEAAAETPDPRDAGASRDAGAADASGGVISKTPPDPPPLTEREQWVFDLRWDRGDVYLLEVHKIDMGAPHTTPRVMGRFALELFEGPTLIERVRFDFPMLGRPRGPGRRNAHALRASSRSCAPASASSFPPRSGARSWSSGTARATCGCRCRGRRRKAPRGRRPTPALFDKRPLNVRRGPVCGQIRAGEVELVRTSPRSRSDLGRRSVEMSTPSPFLPRILGKNPPFVRPFCR